MFVDACKQYWPLSCHVGSSESGASGLGCALSPAFVLTAHHVYQGNGPPVVVNTGGLWRCSVVREWVEDDLALLRKEEKIKTAGADPVGTFPGWSTRMPSLGQSLGFLASLRGPRLRTYFGQGHIAFFDGEEGLRFGLAGALVQRGFSGGPVFDPDAKLVGVLVEAYQFPTNLEPPTLVSMPLFSPIARIAPQLQQLVDPN